MDAPLFPFLLERELALHTVAFAATVAPSGRRAVPLHPSLLEIFFLNKGSRGQSHILTGEYTDGTFGQLTCKLAYSQLKNPEHVIGILTQLLATCGGGDCIRRESAYAYKFGGAAC